MTPEIWTIVGVGIALAGLILTGQRSIRKEIGELRTDLAALREDFARLRERMGGLFEGLREAIAHGRAA